jgi:hypothetical protein
MLYDTARLTGDMVRLHAKEARLELLIGAMSVDTWFRDRLMLR